MERNARDSKLHLLQLIMLWAAAVFFMHPAPSTAQNLTDLWVDTPVIVNTGDTVTIENSRIMIDPKMEYTYPFEIKKDASLIFKNCILDLSNFPEFGRTTFIYGTDATLIFDNTEMSGGVLSTPTGFITCYRCDFTVKNGSKIINNYNTGHKLVAEEGYRGGILYLGDSSLIIEDSDISNNRLRSVFLPENNLTYGIIDSYGTKIAIKNSVISGNNYETGTFLKLIEDGELLIENTLIENNEGIQTGVIKGQNSKKITIDEGTVFRNNTSKNGSCIFVENTQVEIKDNVEFSGNTASSYGGESSYGGVIYTEESDMTIGKVLL